jgi:hypothetical protein
MAAERENNVNGCNIENDKISVIVKMVMGSIRNEFIEFFQII